VGAVIGLIIERLTLRPLIGQPVLAAIMVTLAISYLLKGITLLAWGGHPKIFPRFLPGKVVRMGTVFFSKPFFSSQETHLPICSSMKAI
jgi:branched-chain amino acid transport system permease protein